MFSCWPVHFWECFSDDNCGEWVSKSFKNILVSALTASFLCQCEKVKCLKHTHIHPVTTLLVTGLEFFGEICKVKFPRFGHPLFTFFGTYCMGRFPVSVDQRSESFWRWSLHDFQSGPHTLCSHYCCEQETARGPLLSWHKVSQQKVLLWWNIEQ